MLLWLGCDIGQGWLYGRPVPPEQLSEALAERLNPPPPIPSRASEPPTPACPAPRSSSHAAPRPAQRHLRWCPVGLSFLDRNLRYVSVNKRLAEIHNLPVASHLGRPMPKSSPREVPPIEPYLLKPSTANPTPNSRPGPDPHQPDAPAPYSSPISPRATRWTRSSESPSRSSTSRTARRPKRRSLESEDHYRHAVELNPQIPWTAEPDGIIPPRPRWEPSPV